MFLPWASSARAFCNTSKADSIPMRVIRSASFIVDPVPACGWWMVSTIPDPSTRRLNPDERGVVLLRQDIQGTSGSLSYITDSLTKLAQHRLAADLFPLVVEFDAIDLPCSRTLALTQSTHEHVSLPSGKPVARVERHARERNRRYPHDNRLFHPFLPRLLRDTRTGIAASVADDGPAVVLARLDDVDLVAAIRSLLARPDFAGLRIHRQTELVAMTHRVDLWLVSRTPHKRVVWRNRPVVAKPPQRSAH